MARPTTLTIDLQALRHNFKRTREMVPNSAMMAMVKADAYGHGLENVANAFRQTDAFGVSCLEEAVRLREAGVTTRIVLMEGLFSREELQALEQYHLEPVIHHAYQMAYLKEYRFKQILPLWLKIDTGMHRLGIGPEETQALWQEAENYPYVKPVGLMTHFSQAYYPDKAVTKEQIKCFFG